MQVLVPIEPELVIADSQFAPGQGIGLTRILPTFDMSLAPYDIDRCLSLWNEVSDMAPDRLREKMRALFYGTELFPDDAELGVTIDKDTGVLTIVASHIGGYKSTIALSVDERGEPRARAQLSATNEAPVFGVEYGLRSVDQDPNGPIGKVLVPQHIQYGSARSVEYTEPIYGRTNGRALDDGTLIEQNKEGPRRS